MDRIVDAAAVLLFAGATAFVALYGREYFANDTNDAKTANDAREQPLLTNDAEPYASRVARALPRLERHAAEGSMRDRSLTCDDGDRLADIATIQDRLDRAPDVDPNVSATLAEGLRALRACVACTPEPAGCAAAARAFAKVEDRLALPRSAGGI